jgi:predicted nucleotidyltransferase
MNETRQVRAQVDSWLSYGVEKNLWAEALLLGSLTRSDSFSAQSDVDLVVCLSEEQITDARHSLHKLQSLLGRPVDVSLITPAYCAGFDLSHQQALMVSEALLLHPKSLLAQQILPRRAWLHADALLLWRWYRAWAHSRIGDPSSVLSAKDQNILRCIEHVTQQSFPCANYLAWNELCWDRLEETCKKSSTDKTELPPIDFRFLHKLLRHNPARPVVTSLAEWSQYIYDSAVKLDRP